MVVRDRQVNAFYLSMPDIEDEHNRVILIQDTVDVVRSGICFPKRTCRLLMFVSFRLAGADLNSKQNTSVIVTIWYTGD
jgi:hypothetical protein